MILETNPLGGQKFSFLLSIWVGTPENVGEKDGERGADALGPVLGEEVGVGAEQKDAEPG